MNVAQKTGNVIVGTATAVKDGAVNIVSGKTTDEATSTISDEVITEEAEEIDDSVNNPSEAVTETIETAKENAVDEVTEEASQ